MWQAAVARRVRQSCRSLWPVRSPLGRGAEDRLLLRSIISVPVARSASCASTPAPDGRTLRTYSSQHHLSANEQTFEPFEPSVAHDSTVTLRNYQSDAIQACLDAFDRGLTRIGVSSPTGSGKTTMFMHLIPAVRERSGCRDRDGTGKTLILVSGIELASQTEVAAKRILGEGWRVEVEQGNRKASGRADVTIATYQTLNNADRLQKFDPGTFDLIIVDEAHHCAALSYLRLLHYFNEGVELPAIMSPVMKQRTGHQVPIVGFSATFSRADQLALSAVFQEIVYHREITTMLDEGWLSPTRFTAVQYDLDLPSLPTSSTTGDFVTSSLAARLNTSAVNDLVVRSYLHKAADRRSTLVFAVDLDHVANLVEAFRAAGVDARSVSSRSHPRDRRETLQAFKDGEFPVLVNCQVLTEAADIPCIDCILLARPTKSKNLLAQMVGRGLRLSPETGKVDCHIIDLVDNTSDPKGMLVAPSLWGLSHDDVPPIQRSVPHDEDAPSSSSATTLAESADEEGQSGGRVKSVTFIERDDPFRLHKAGYKPLEQMSKNAWVACGREKYILELLGKGFIRIEPYDPEKDLSSRARSISPTDSSASPLFSIWFRDDSMRHLDFMPDYTRPRKIADADSLERAIQTGDMFAERKMGRERVKQLSRYAAWRAKAPSHKALDKMIKMSKTAEIDAGGRMVAMQLGGRRVEKKDITAGHVSSYICAATHGAIGARRKIDSQAQTLENRAQRKAEKALRMAERNLPLPPSR